MTPTHDLTARAHRLPFAPGEVAPATTSGAMREDRLAIVYGPVVLLAVALSLLTVLWGFVLHDLRQDRASAISAAVRENVNLARALEERS